MEDAVESGKNSDSTFSIIKHLDYLGKRPKLMASSDSDTHKTFIGGILTVILTLLTLVGLSYFGKELFLKTLPMVIYSKSYDEDPPQYNLTQDKFNFFIGIQDKDFNYYTDTSIFNITIYNFNATQTDKDMIYSQNHYRLEICNLTRHFPNYIEQFKNQELDKLFCLHPDDNKNLKLRGTWGHGEHLAIYIDIGACQNNTHKGIVCKPDEEIKEMLSGGYYIINYLDTIFDNKNYSHPEKKVRRDFFTSMSNKYYKEYGIFFKNVDYITDDGFLLEHSDVKRYLQFEVEKELYDFRTTSELIFRNFIRLSTFRDIYSRRYNKVQDVLAALGGLMKGLLVITSLLYNSFNKFDLNLKLVNQLYYSKPLVIKQNDQKMLKRLLFNPKSVKIQNVNKNKNLKLNNSSEIVVNNSSLNLTSVQIPILLKLFEEKSKLKTTQKIKIILCSYVNKKLNSSKLKIYYSLSEYINTKLNVVNLLKFIDEGELLKKVLLTKEESYVLRYLSEFKINDYNKFNEFGKKSENVKNAVNSLIIGETSEASKKLVEMIQLLN